MRILQLISPIGLFGAEKVMVELSKELCSTEYKPYIGVIGNPQNYHTPVVIEAEKSGLEVKEFHCSGKFDIKTISAIRKYIKDNKIGMIHSHGYKSNFYALLATLNMNIKRIITCHNWLGISSKMKFYKLIDKILLKKFDKIVAVSDILKDEIIRGNIPENKVRVVYNGIDISRLQVISDKLQVKKSLGIKENEKVIGTVGRLTEEKGYIYLLRAAEKVVREFPDTIFLIIGDGQLRDSLKFIVHSLQLNDKVIFTGIRDDIPELLNLIDIFVMPSLKEGMPIALLEAMAAKKPIIASKVGAIPKVIEDGYSGLLVESGNEQELSESIIKLLNNPEKANSLAQNGYEKAKSEFSAKNMAEKYMEVYKSMMIGN